MILILFLDSSENQLRDNFVVCTSSSDCYPISPSILISILGEMGGENLPTSAPENDVNIGKREFLFMISPLDGAHLEPKATSIFWPNFCVPNIVW